MGKAGKKTKSDRINALRKQYDAFLDEDKKRKDRNEFILGRLEKMRMCTPSELPVRQTLGSPQISKYHLVSQDRPEYDRKIRFDDNPILHSSPDILPACVLKDEHRILQEISKRYILIPKLRLTNKYNVTYNPPSVSNDPNWRNKYNILDELKKIEKDGSAGVSKDTNIFNYRENNEFKSSVAAPDDVTLNINRNPKDISQEKVPATNLKTKNAKIDSTNDTDYENECKMTLKNEQEYIIPNTVKSADFENEVVLSGLSSISQEQRFPDFNKVKEESPVSQNVVKLKPRNENKNFEKLSYNQTQFIKQKEIKVIDNIALINADQISENVTNIKNEPVTQNNMVEVSNAKIDDNNISILLPSIEKENIDLSLKTDELVAYPAEIIENLESANAGQSEPFAENIQQQEYETNNETTIVTDDVIPSQIDEFEAEQTEMVYSEETVYNQNDDTIGYNAKNEEYTNEQYPYYNESQQEQPYYPEINEHEESTERYDPNYEQQYVENYEENVNVANYENQQYIGDNYENQQDATIINYEQQPDQQDLTNVNYEAQPVNYEYEHSTHPDNPEQSQTENINTYNSQPSEQVNYDTQQYEVGDIEHPVQNVYESHEYIQMHTDQETIQNLEHQLDGEEGYIEPPNTYPSEHIPAVENVNETE